MKLLQAMPGLFSGKFKFRVKSETSRSILLYLVFVVISAMFWYFITLNKDVQQDVTFQFEITGIPKEVTMIDDAPSSINVTVRDKGSAFLKYSLFMTPKIKVKFSDFAESNSGYFKMNAVQLRNAVKMQLNREAIVVSLLPDDILLKFTNLPGKKVPIRPDWNIQTNFQYEVNGPLVLSQDSVMVYSDRETLAEINEVYTYHAEATDLTDTLRRDLTIAPIRGAKIEPRTVSLMVPVEQLIEKHKRINITVRNTPPNVNFVIFPSSADVSYLVPKSMYKINRDDIKLIVDYNTVNLSSKSNKAPVIISEYPGVYRNMELLTDSVEYIIENR